MLQPIVVQTTRMLKTLDKADTKELYTKFNPSEICSTVSPCGMGTCLTFVMDNSFSKNLDVFDNFMRKHRISYVAHIENKKISDYFASEHDQFRLTPLHIL